MTATESTFATGKFERRSQRSSLAFFAMLSREEALSDWPRHEQAVVVGVDLPAKDGLR